MALLPCGLRRIGSCTRDPLPETIRTRRGDSSRRGTDAGGIRSGLPPMPIALIHSPRPEGVAGVKKPFLGQ
jgi:hypothetical protein